MRNETFLLIVFIILNLSSDLSTETETNNGGHAPQVRSNIRDSFNQLVKSAVTFFNVSIGLIEARRRKIKKAFFKFIDESFKDKKVESDDNTTDTDTTNTNLSRLSNHFVNAESIFSSTVLSHGYQVETHTVLTSDGYILTLHKLQLKHENFVKMRKPIVLFQHGIFGSSADWVVLGSKRSLPYLILKSGCEVWLANFRGNAFSRSHVSKMIDSPDFWDFSVHEMGMYDLSATLDYIIDVSDKNPEIIFIGHSSGCAALLILLAAAPRYNGLIKVGIFLAPVVFMSHTKGPMRYLGNLYNKIDTSTMNENSYDEYVPEGKAAEQVLRIFCKNYNSRNVLTCLRYSADEDIPNSLSSTILEAASTSGSEKALIHFFQMMKSGHFRWFDYGKSENILRYGQAVPPRYNLQNVELKIYVFTSSEDLLSNEEDVNILINYLPKVEDHVVITRRNFSHIHFLVDEFVSEFVYNRLSNFFE